MSHEPVLCPCCENAEAETGHGVSAVTVFTARAYVMVPCSFGARALHFGGQLRQVAARAACLVCCASPHIGSACCGVRLELPQVRVVHPATLHGADLQQMRVFCPAGHGRIAIQC
eukprot:jgi/Ulvmu1/6443/UM003_0073.1